MLDEALAHLLHEIEARQSLQSMIHCCCCGYILLKPQFLVCIWQRQAAFYMQNKLYVLAHVSPKSIGMC